MGSLFGGGKQKSSTTQNQSWGPTGYISDAYKGLVGQAQQTAQTPWNSATQQNVAGFTAPQQQGFSTVQQTVGDYQPYLSDAGALADRGSAAITGADISNYMNPYTDQVIGSAINDWDRMSDRRMADVNSNASKMGALTGDRSQVAQALAREASDREMSSGIANLRNQGWQSALGAAQTDASRALQGSQIQSGLGSLAQQLGFNDANALLGIGGMQQDQKQKVLDANTVNAKAQSAYPFETQPWLASILQGVGSQAGGTSTGTGSSTSKTSGGGLGQLVGLGATLFGMSDERVKEDIQPIGETFDGQPIYRYRFAGSPKTEIGLMAQEVEQRHPEAVADIGGLKHVNYQAATEDAARPAYADGGGVGELRNTSYVPISNMRPTASMQPPQMSVPAASSGGSSGMGEMLEGLKMAKEAIGGTGGSGLGAMMRTTTDPSSGWSTTVNPSSASGWGNYLSSGLGGLASGIGSAFGFADGGVVEEQPSGLGGVRPTASAAAPEAYKHVLWNNGLGEDASNAIMMAGLGMIAGGGRNGFEDIGRGGLAGINYYTQAQRQRKADAEAKAKEAQGKMMEIGGKLVRLMPDGTTSVVYNGGGSTKYERIGDQIVAIDPDAKSITPVYSAPESEKDKASREKTAAEIEEIKQKNQLNSAVLRMLPQDAPSAPVDGVQSQSFNGSAPGAGIVLAADGEAPEVKPLPDTIKTPIGEMTPDEAKKRAFALSLVGKGDAGKLLYDETENEIQKKTKSDIEEKTIGTATQLARLADIQKQFDPKFLEVAERLKLTGAGWTAKLGGTLSPEVQKQLGEFAKFRSSAVNNLNAILKEVSGAAVTPQEYERIQSDQPTAGTGIFDGDDPISFKSKMEATTARLKAAMARLNFMRANGLKFDRDNLDQFMSLEEVPDRIRKRGKEIEGQIRSSNPSIDPSALQDLTKKKLKREFGI